MAYLEFGKILILLWQFLGYWAYCRCCKRQKIENNLAIRSHCLPSLSIVPRSLQEMADGRYIE